MYANGVMAATPATASGAVRLGRRSGALGGGRHAVGANAFAGNVKAFKTRATLGRKASAAVPLRVVAEKVVGIDLGTTNSAVRPARAFPSARRRTGVRMDVARHRESSCVVFQGSGFG